MDLNNWKETTFTGETGQSYEKLQQSKEIIYSFFTESLATDDFETILDKFDKVFINYQPNLIPESVATALQKIIKSNNEVFFIATIKHCCYVLIYPLIKNKQYTDVIKIINIFSNGEPEIKNTTTTLIRSENLVKNKLKSWIKNFSNTNDYQELKTLIYQFDVSSRNHWTHRYLEYSFFLQYFNSDNSQEQKQVAFLLIKTIQKEFKFNLAIYLTKFQFGDQKPTNPTILNEKILRFIKKIAAKKEATSYKNVAKIFLEQTQKINYSQFKIAFIKYLTFSLYSEKIITIIETKLANKLKEIYQDNNDKPINEGLLLRTCNKTLDLLITTQGKPTDIFILLISYGNPYAIVILLLKIALISPNSRTHLDKKIAELLKCYQNYTETECQWFINLIEIFRITFTIYADENAQFNLVKVDNQLTKNNMIDDLDSYQFFLKYKKK